MQKRKGRTGLQMRKITFHWDLSRYAARLATLYEVGAGSIRGGDRRIDLRTLDAIEKNPAFKGIIAAHPRVEQWLGALRDAIQRAGSFQWTRYGPRLAHLWFYAFSMPRKIGFGFTWTHAAAPAERGAGSVLQLKRFPLQHPPRQGARQVLLPSPGAIMDAYVLVLLEDLSQWDVTPIVTVIGQVLRWAHSQRARKQGTGQTWKVTPPPSCDDDPRVLLALEAPLAEMTRWDIAAALACLRRTLHAALKVGSPWKDGIPARLGLMHCRDATFRRDIERYRLYREERLSIRAIAHYESMPILGRLTLETVRKRIWGPHKHERSVSASIKRIHAAITLTDMPPQWFARAQRTFGQRGTRIRFTNIANHEHWLSTAPGEPTMAASEWVQTSGQSAHRRSVTLRSVRYDLTCPFCGDTNATPGNVCPTCGVGIPRDIA